MSNKLLCLETDFNHMYTYTYTHAGTHTGAMKLAPVSVSFS